MHINTCHGTANIGAELGYNLNGDRVNPSNQNPANANEANLNGMGDCSVHNAK